ncbi:MAG: preprotein translocase subunit SecG [Culicoidibacterales bacterium]
MNFELIRELINYALPVVAIVLIILVVAQGAKADGASSFIVGGGAEERLFADMKERGIEVFLTRTTWIFTILLLVLSVARLALY